MSKHTIRMVIALVVLSLLQVVLLNHLLLFDYFLPILFLYPILRMPYRYEPWVLTLIAAIVGLLIDLMMNTPGLNMASATLATYCRPALLKLFADPEELVEDDDESDPALTARLMGRLSYTLYLISFLLVQIGSLFLLEAFSAGLFLHTLPFIAGSIGITMLLFLIFDTLFAKRRRG